MVYTSIKYIPILIHKMEIKKNKSSEALYLYKLRLGKRNIKCSISLIRLGIKKNE
jgi:hypothetical protein